MSLAWERLGHVYAPGEGAPGWLVSHAANPIPERLDGDRYRIYFNYRDADQRSGVAALHWRLRTNEVEEVLPDPLLTPGPVGAFDDRGTSLGSLVPVNSPTGGADRYLYYTGWNILATRRPNGQPAFANTIGLAISRDGGPFERHSAGPLLARSGVDPFSMSYPWVEAPHADYPWRMWYGSNTSWGDGKRDMEHVIKLAVSRDGLAWEATGTVCIDVLGDHAYAFSRPCLVRDRGVYRMWFSQRGALYTIGTATSADGVVWKVDRDDVFGPGEAPWEDEAVCYQYVFDHDGERYALYCGNRYGKTGFGLARLVT